MTVHKDLTERLHDMDFLLWQRVRDILAQNKAERHIRGGEATRIKYQRAGSAVRPNCSDGRSAPEN